MSECSFPLPVSTWLVCYSWISSCLSALFPPCFHMAGVLQLNKFVSKCSFPLPVSTWLVCYSWISSCLSAIFPSLFPHGWCVTAEGLHQPVDRGAGLQGRSGWHATDWSVLCVCGDGWVGWGWGWAVHCVYVLGGALLVHTLCVWVHSACVCVCVCAHAHVCLCEYTLCACFSMEGY